MAVNNRGQWRSSNLVAAYHSGTGRSPGESWRPCCGSPSSTSGRVGNCERPIGICRPEAASQVVHQYVAAYCRTELQRSLV